MALSQQQLTKRDIIHCEPGLQLDKWVAQALNWPEIGNKPYRLYKGKHDGIISFAPELFGEGLIPRRWNPSQNLGDAQYLLEHTTRSTREDWELRVFSTGYQAVYCYEGGRERPWQPGEHEAESLFSLEHAICQAFLCSLIPAS